MFYMIPFLLAIVAARLEILDEDSAARRAIPSIYGVSEIGDTPEILWLPVDEYRFEPVLGYKLKVWEVGCVSKETHKVVDGEMKTVTERVMPSLRDTSTLHNLQVFTIEGVNSTRFPLKGFKRDVPYHFVVCSYSSDGDEEDSSPFRMQIEGTHKCKEY